jgi:hypothetical protein
MRRKWATLGYQILRISHFLRAISRRGASADAQALTFPAGNTQEAAVPLARTVTRGNKG